MWALLPQTLSILNRYPGWLPIANSMLSYGLYFIFILLLCFMVTTCMILILTFDNCPPQSVSPFWGVSHISLYLWLLYWHTFSLPPLFLGIVINTFSSFPCSEVLPPLFLVHHHSYLPGPLPSRSPSVGLVPWEISPNKELTDGGSKLTSFSSIPDDEGGPWTLVAPVTIFLLTHI